MAKKTQPRREKPDSQSFWVGSGCSYRVSGHYQARTNYSKQGMDVFLIEEENHKYEERLGRKMCGGLIKEIETGHMDEDDHEAEDVDVDVNEDDLSSPRFFKKDNGPDVDMGENVSLGEPLKEVDDNEDVYPELPNIFNESYTRRSRNLC
ncbi:unnamed protein product [Lactuca saligna]|uniref:Uncharacterized protein n=1 Tax=Lactuca saligna TaxID=75948 RepID=A0AA35Y783_LACSI|nr:unnamed protein product [Lactuca saligna]